MFPRVCLRLLKPCCSMTSSTLAPLKLQLPLKLQTPPRSLCKRFSCESEHEATVKPKSKFRKYGLPLVILDCGMWLFVAGTSTLLLSQGLLELSPEQIQSMAENASNACAGYYDISQYDADSLIECLHDDSTKNAAALTLGLLIAFVTSPFRIALDLLLLPDFIFLCNKFGFFMPKKKKAKKAKKLPSEQES